MIEFDATRPKWVQIRDVIARDIREGRLVPGDRVPSAVDITETYGVAIATARKVIASLRADGLVRTETGIGSFVK